MPDSMWVMTPSRMGAWARRFAHRQPLPWCYLGSDVGRRAAALRVRGWAGYIEIGEPLNQVAEELRQPFLDWLAGIGSRQRRPQEWWGLRMASKSPLQNDLFLLVCYATLVEGWVGGRWARPDVIIVEDVWLASMLKRRLRRHPEVRVLAGSWAALARERTAALVRAVWARGRFLAWSVWMVAHVRRVFHEQPRGWESEAGPRVLLFTWIDERLFAVPGKLSDSYTGRLEELLTQQGAQVIRLTPLYLGIRHGFLKPLQALASRVIVTPRSLSLMDVLRAACARPRITALAGEGRFQDRDWRLLLCRELWRERAETEFFGYRLWSLALRRIARRYGPGVKVLIYPFENQPWEKLLCLAFRHEAPHVRLIGYQHASMSPLLLGYFLGKGEATFMPLPDRVMTNGRHSLRILEQGGFDAERLCNGGALRFEHLLAPTSPSARQSRHLAKQVLIVLPMSSWHAGVLLHDLRELFHAPLILDAGHPAVTFLLKEHPHLPLKKLMDTRQPLPAWLTVTTLPLTQLWGTVDAMIYAPPTASWLEAYAMGVPVVKYQGEWLDIDPAIVAKSDPRVRTATRSTLRAVLEEMLTTPWGPVDRAAVLREVFSSVDERAWTSLAEEDSERVESRT